MAALMGLSRQTVARAYLEGAGSDCPFSPKIDV